MFINIPDCEKSLHLPDINFVLYVSVFCVLMFCSITGIVLVTLSDSKNTKGGISIGALWALGSAFL